jgi:O-antigen/teichoic acid export membrane protein
MQQNWLLSRSKILSSPLLRDVLSVVTGAAAGQVVVVAFSPLISRIYSPEVFGLQGVFLSLVSVLSPIVALRYPMAVVVAKDNTDAWRLGRLSLYIAFGLSCLLGLILAVGQQSVLRLLGADDLGALIWFLPLALFCVAMQDVTDFGTARLGAFRVVGIANVVQAFVANSARVIGGLIAPVAAVLVAVTTATPALQAAMQRYGTRRISRSAGRRLSRARAVALLRKHRDFPLYRMPTDVLNAASQSVPVLMLAALFSPAAAGLYALARSVINLPLNIVGTALGNVFYSHLAEMKRDGRPLMPLVAKATLFQVAIPGGAMVVAIPVLPWAFSTIFGQPWLASGQFGQWMVLWVVGMLANIPTVRALPVIGVQKWHLLFNSLITAGGVLGMLAGYKLHGTAMGSVAFYSVSVACLYVLQILTYLHLVRNHDRKLKNGE